MGKTVLETMIGYNETIIWRGKPNKKCFILESIFNPLLPFALIWALVDGFIIGGAFMSGQKQIMGFIAIFMLIHLMPVWLYLGGVIFSFVEHRHTEYIVTDKGIYVSGGKFAFKYEMKPFTDLSHISIHRGIFDQWLGVGDVISVCGHGTTVSSSHSGHAGSNITIKDISDYQRVFQIVKDLQTDIYADTMYPNDLRPETNHGYRTQYTKAKDYADDTYNNNNNNW